MKLKHKILGGLAGVFLLLFLSFYVVSLRLKEGFAEIERDSVVVNARRVKDALDELVVNFQSRQADWAQWDDTYAFVEDRNEEFIRSNMTSETMVSATRVGLMVFINRRGETVFRKMVDMKTAREIPFPEEFEKLFEPGSPLLNLPDMRSVAGGIVATSSGTPFIFTSRPILTSEIKGPVRGVLVWGNYLDEATLQKVSEVTHLSFELKPLDPFRGAKQAAAGEVVVTENSADSISGAMVLRDLHGAPRFSLRVDLPRPIHHQGTAAIRVAMLFLILSVVLVGFLLTLLLRRVILLRLARIREAFAEVAEGAEIRVKIPPMGRDEVGELAASFNAMTDELQESQKKIREQNAQLLQAQKMESIGRLTGGVAHDFNNLLGIMMGYCELALQTLKADDPVHGHLRDIKEAGERAVALTRQLLAFGRKQVMQPKVVDLNGVLGSMERMIQRLIGEDVRLVVALTPDLGAVMIDPHQIEQVIFNLAANARDAMPRGGTLTIETKNVVFDGAHPGRPLGVPPGSYVMAAISDTGAGMDEETVSHLFEPFFTTKEKGKGAGMGLSMVYGIVKQSGGYVSVRSKTGAGTVFEIHLPRVEREVERAPTQAPAVECSKGSEIVMVAEDEERLRSLICQVLQKKGYAVLEAASGREAVKLGESREEPIDLLVTDVIMPGGISGREAADRLAAKRPGMRILYISGFTDDIIAQHGVLEEGTHFLQKPFTPEDLTRKVREILDGR